MPLGDASATPCSLQVLQSQEIEGTNQGVHLLLVEDQETLLARTLSERVTCSEQGTQTRDFEDVISYLVVLLVVPPNRQW